MFILQRTNFVSTKNIDNCVLLFLYVFSINHQAEVRRNAHIQVPEGCHWPSHYIECMMEEKKKRSPDYYDLVGIFYELACTQRPKPDGLVILRNQNQTLFFNSNTSSCLYQCYCGSSHFTIHYYFIFPQKCKSVPYFLQLLN